MAVLSCASPLSATDVGRTLYSDRPRCLPCTPSRPCACLLSVAEPNKWRALAAAVVSFGGMGTMPAIAELNKLEAEMRGEFGIGSAAQFGSADLKKAVHVNENFRRANFTSADMRESDFSGSTFNGAYMEKAIAYKATFSGADLSYTLMDRMVLNEANLRNAIVVRSVLICSDLAGAIIEGADFSDAVLDLPQKQFLPFINLSKKYSLSLHQKEMSSSLLFRHSLVAAILISFIVTKGAIGVEIPPNSSKALSLADIAAVLYYQSPKAINVQVFYCLLGA